MDKLIDKAMCVVMWVVAAFLVVFASALLVLLTHAIADLLIVAMF